MTISKANFAAMSVTMLAILFLFQFSNISVLYTSTATINHNAEEKLELLSATSIQASNLRNDLDYSTAIIGTALNYETNLAQEWCVYQKRSFARFESLYDFSNHTSTSCELAILGSGVINSVSDVATLEQTCKYKIHIIFTSLPKLSLIEKSEALQEILGIKQIKASACRTNGLTLFEGFLFGGKISYEKLKKTVPYFKLKSGIKTYMVGNIKDQKEKKIKNEDLPPILWRYHTKDNFVFVVNADFFKDHTGLGILTAMLSEMKEYTIYPVVNAQCLVCQNYPYLSNENKDTISKRYYYETQAFSQNVLWPDLISILDATGEHFSGMIAPKLEYDHTLEGISTDTVSFYYKQTEQVSGNLGLSGDQIGKQSLYDKKVQYDTEMFEQKVPSYTFTIFSPGQMPEPVYRPYLNGEKTSLLSDIRTLVTDRSLQSKPIFSFYNERILSMANTNNGFTHKDAEDLYLRSIETALAYSSICLDFSQIYYPASLKDEWTRLSKDLSRFTQTYWKEYRKAFDQMTISEADKRVRAFLALDYHSVRSKDTILLTIDHVQEEASFILRLSNEKVIQVSGGSYQQIEPSVYLIHAGQHSVSIMVADDGKEQL